MKAIKATILFATVSQSKTTTNKMKENSKEPLKLNLAKKEKMYILMTMHWWDQHLKLCVQIFKVSTNNIQKDIWISQTHFLTAEFSRKLKEQLPLPARLDWRNWKGILNTTFVPHLGTTKQEEIAGSRVRQETRSWKTVPKSAAERKWDAFSKQTSPSFPIFFTLSFSKWKYTCHLGLLPIWLMMPMCCVFTYSPECWGYWTFFFFFFFCPWKF